MNEQEKIRSTFYLENVKEAQQRYWASHNGRIAFAAWLANGETLEDIGLLFKLDEASENRTPIDLRNDIRSFFDDQDTIDAVEIEIEKLWAIQREGL